MAHDRPVRHKYSLIRNTEFKHIAHIFSCHSPISGSFKYGFQQWTYSGHTTSSRTAFTVRRHFGFGHSIYLHHNTVCWQSYLWRRIHFFGH